MVLITIGPWGAIVLAGVILAHTAASVSYLKRPDGYQCKSADDLRCIWMKWGPMLLGVVGATYLLYRGYEDMAQPSNIRGILLA